MNSSFNNYQLNTRLQAESLSILPLKNIQDELAVTPNLTRTNSPVSDSRSKYFDLSHAEVQTPQIRERSDFLLLDHKPFNRIIFHQPIQSIKEEPSMPQLITLEQANMQFQECCQTAPKLLQLISKHQSEHEKQSKKPSFLYDQLNTDFQSEDESDIINLVEESGSLIDTARQYPKLNGKQGSNTHDFTTMSRRKKQKVMQKVCMFQQTQQQEEENEQQPIPFPPQGIINFELRDPLEMQKQEIERQQLELCDQVLKIYKSINTLKVNALNGGFSCSFCEGKGKKSLFGNQYMVGGHTRHWHLQQIQNRLAKKKAAKQSDCLQENSKFQTCDTERPILVSLATIGTNELTLQQFDNAQYSQEATGYRNQTEHPLFPKSTYTFNTQFQDESDNISCELIDQIESEYLSLENIAPQDKQLFYDNGQDQFSESQNSIYNHFNLSQNKIINFNFDVEDQEWSILNSNKSYQEKKKDQIKISKQSKKIFKSKQF